MTTKTIMVIDDDKRTRENWVERLRKIQTEFEPRTISTEDFKLNLNGLRERRKKARRNPNSDWDSNIFDKVDILVVDYDLFDPDHNLNLNGDEVAYLSRCYSQCGLIIGVNRDKKPNPFDLRLTSHLDSFADINIGDKQIDKSGLWEQPWTGFRPWHWPLLPIALRSFNTRIKEIEGALNTPIIEFLRLPEDMTRILPPSIRGFIENDGKELEKIKFRDFVESYNNALRGKDRPFNDEAVARIAATRVFKWLDQMILPGQGFLVDAPHLVERFPSLVSGDKSNAVSWNRTALFKGVSKLGLNYRKIKPCSFQRTNWLSRHAWFWPQLSKFDEIAEVNNPWSIDRPNLVFCEDISQFLPKEDTREFTADVDSRFVIRNVVDRNSAYWKQHSAEFRSVEYLNRNRFFT